MYPCPQTRSEVRRFVGLGSWNRRFIGNFADHMFPINALPEGKKKKQPIRFIFIL